MSRITDGLKLNEGEGTHGGEDYCHVCRSPLSLVKAIDEPTSMGMKWAEVFVCRKGHVYSRGALDYLDSHELV
jgi:hypothetical protein